MANAAKRGSAVAARFPSVYPILDTEHLASSGIGAVRLAEAMASAGIRIAQYRHKGSFTRDVFEEAAAVGAVLQSRGARFIVNDRADIAMALGADGVHVGQGDLPVGDVRRIVGPEMVVGYSTHNATQLSGEECSHADYLAIGPVFATSSKLNPDPVVGLDGVRQARSLTDKPLVAIGGIAIESAGEVLLAGADSVAMISGISVGNLSRWVRIGLPG